MNVSSDIIVLYIELFSAQTTSCDLQSVLVLPVTLNVMAEMSNADNYPLEKQRAHDVRMCVQNIS